MRFTTFLPAAGLLAAWSLAAQAPGKFPRDSLVNTKIIPKNTPVLQVIGTMRNFATDLSVRCQFCHALPLLDFNETMFPGSSGMAVIRGNILLMRADTAAAATAFREAIRRDSTNTEARGRLRDVGGEG